MNTDLDKILGREKEIRAKSPWVHAAIAVVFLVMAALFLLAAIATPEVGSLAAACGACFGVAAIAFTSHLTTVQSKVNLDLCKAIQEIKAKAAKSG